MVVSEVSAHVWLDVCSGSTMKKKIMLCRRKRPLTLHQPGLQRQCCVFTKHASSDRLPLITS